ncbi:MULTISPECIES: SDR family oxidoreductase [Streptacidiphilus]|uniref:SDR family oxidoreductase n=1 Tax=Streptacidiphilus cavernicola TaxID=3342716 RepID=A0ABV6UL36_9ACTN|nr:SDR family oxidoreductase [Streptacidiphilus jeojiense]
MRPTEPTPTTGPTRTAIVTGAGRGFGRATAIALSRAGMQVVGVARDRTDLEKVHADLGDSFVPFVADATDPAVAEQLLTRYTPHLLVLNAGAVPYARPVQEYTWEDFSLHWQVDVQHVFHWTRLALTVPLPPGSTVLAVSSGAALRGSPVSGGYAGAKATVRFLASYAAEESQRAGLGLRFLSVLPPMTPGARVGDAGVAGYAARAGVTEAEFVQRLGPVPTPDQIGRTIADLALEPDLTHGSYQLTASGSVGLD